MIAKTIYIQLFILFLSFYLSANNIIINAIDKGNGRISKKDTADIVNYKDGPYIIWKRKRKLIAYYYYTNKKGKTRVEKRKDKTSADTFHFKGFVFDTNKYILHKYNKIDKANWYNIENIFAVGDVHGEFYEMIKLLLYNSVIDENLNWIWGNGHLVFTGDIFDRGDYVTECLWFIYKLEQQAEKAGGKVHFVLGTHELLKFTKFNGYLSDKYNYLFTQRYKLYYDYYSEKFLLGKWLRSKNTLIKINDNLFVHGGISPEFFELELTVDTLNYLTRKFFKKTYKYKRNKIIQTIIGKNGPYWYRGFNKNEEGKIDINEAFIDKVLKFYGVSRIIFAHTEVEEIMPAINGKLINIDIPMGVKELESQALLIKGNKYYKVYTNKPPVLIKVCP